MPRIGITISSPRNLWWYHDYFDRIREFGAEPVAIDAMVQHEDVLPRVDGLLLSGGADVTPSYYGEEPHSTVRSRAELDAMEVPLVRLALEQKVPILGICRGHQLLNVACGGRLIQHIETRRHESFADVPGDTSQWHDVRISAESLLGRLTGKTEIEVNSRHHQGLTEEMIAPGLTATAWSDDGLVEGLELMDRDRFVLSVQWHPERPEKPSHFNEAFAPLFRALLEAAESRRPGR